MFIPSEKYYVRELKLDWENAGRDMKGQKTLVKGLGYMARSTTSCAGQGVPGSLLQDRSCYQLCASLFCLGKNTLTFPSSPPTQPDFFRLLDILGVGVIERSATICVFDPASGQRGTTVLPPPFLINGHGWLRGMHDLGRATALFQLLLHGRKLLEKGDNDTTIEEAIAQLHNTQVCCAGS